MEYRTLGPEDYDDIISVWNRAGLPYKPKGRDKKDNIIKQMAKDPEMFQGCLAGTKLVGVVIGSYDGRKGYINRLAVIPEWQRKGIARGLIEELEKVFHDRGIKVIEVLVEEWGTDSKALFESMGFVPHDDITYYSKRESRDI